MKEKKDEEGKKKKAMMKYEQLESLVVNLRLSLDYYLLNWMSEKERMKEEEKKKMNEKKRKKEL